MSEIKINNIPVITENNGSVELTTGTADIGNNALVVDSSGNVGIGTNSPSQTLTIYNGYDNQIKLQNGANANQSYEFGRNGSDGLLTFYGNQSGFTGYVFDGVDGERMRIDSSGHVTMPYQPAFSVAKSDVSGQIAAGVYVFNQVHLNRGGHYSTSTGRFTAPVEGAYFFIASLQLYGGTYAYCRFQKNGSDIYTGGISAAVYEDGPDVHETITFSAVINLATNDYVTVERNQTTRGMQSSFSGYLIG